MMERGQAWRLIFAGLAVFWGSVFSILWVLL
jgi:hypothetical protein